MRAWLKEIFSTDDDSAPQQRLSVPPIAGPAPPPAAEPELLAPADLARLAEQLAQLIERAQQRLDGAVELVDRSADEAAEYGRQLADDAASLDDSGLPTAMVDALIGFTRTMIDRTLAAEARLRATNDELRGLQHDLTEAKETAERDPLTSLPNRRALENALKRAIATAQASNSVLSVAFCDIDSFKRLNDVHGHAVGDRVLRLVADCLDDNTGEEVFVGRQGGEEFVMLFEGHGAAAAAAMVDEIREGLSGRTLRSRSDGTPIGAVTFSAGVAELQPDESGEELLERADQAMYRAKDGGRNQVVIDGQTPADYV